MATKTWKIGEYCAGGIITVEITGKIIQIHQKEWDFSKGSNRSSDQSKAEILFTGTVEATDQQAYWKIHDFLNNITTSYWADEVIKWIKSKVIIQHSIWYKNVLRSWRARLALIFNPNGDQILIKKPVLHMTIELIPYTQDYLIPEDGRYLVKTISTHLKTIGYLQARCTRVWNKKRQRHETSIDVSNQTVTHISLKSLEF